MVVTLLRAGAHDRSARASRSLLRNAADTATAVTGGPSSAAYKALATVPTSSAGAPPHASAGANAGVSSSPPPRASEAGLNHHALCPCRLVLMCSGWIVSPCWSEPRHVSMYICVHACVLGMMRWEGGAGWGTRSVFDQRGDYSDVSKPKVDTLPALPLFFLPCPCSPSPSPVFLSCHLSRNTH